jgi:hypothetical protein
MVRDPIARLISELNYCQAVKWVGEQTCTGFDGAEALKQRVLKAKMMGGPAEAFTQYAEHRGNQQLEHIGRDSFLESDFVQPGEHHDWHKRDPWTRINPIERRRARLGPLTKTHLAEAKTKLVTKFAAVGILEQYEESVRVFFNYVVPNADVDVHAIVERSRIESHDSTVEFGNGTAHTFAASDLSEDQIRRVQFAVQLDRELHTFAKQLLQDDIKLSPEELQSPLRTELRRKIAREGAS